MSHARLLSVTLERFKSFEAPTELQLGHLTIILGRNNSGKSSLIQCLLLLKQTLNDPRLDVMLKLEGTVEALNLRELTFGWPQAATLTPGPTISVVWESLVDVQAALVETLSKNLEDFARNSNLAWLKGAATREWLRCKLTLETADANGVTQVSAIKLWSERACDADALKNTSASPGLEIRHSNGTWRGYWKGRVADKLTVQMQHFVPNLVINRRNIGPRHGQRAWHNAYLLLYAQPLADLNNLLSNFHYLGSSRQPPQTLYKTSTAPSELGVSGENTASLLHRRQNELVHFLPPLQEVNGKITIPDSVRTRTFVDAVNEVMRSLSIDSEVKTKDIQDVGFQLMFGQASIVHVGRGLNSLLPMVGLGLFADPLRFQGEMTDLTLLDYRNKCPAISNIALEEPEAHVHPKVASRLAHWLVSLALSNRQIIVETHSDHLVRRLRRLAATAERGSEFEQWLLNHVKIATVEQKNGHSTLTASHLTAEGGLGEVWPVDFMDEATDEESAIYYARMEKAEPPAASAGKVTLVKGKEPEPAKEP